MQKRMARDAGTIERLRLATPRSESLASVCANKECQQTR
jgi:hypothetical protein